MNRFEQLSAAVYELIEDIDAGTVVVRKKTVAMNSLYLLRDALIDLRFTYRAIEQLSKRRTELMSAQVKAKNFSGDLHAEYHDVAGQLRAARIALLQQGKRVLNNSSHVLASMLSFDRAVKVGSFGKQYQWALTVDTKKLDKRDKGLLQNLTTRGKKLEVHNENRDHYVEHSAPASVIEQPRPVHGTGGMHYMQRRPGFAGVEELLLPGEFREFRNGFVVMAEREPKTHKEVLTYHVHVARYLVQFKSSEIRPLYAKEPPSDDPDHYKNLEPHTHQFFDTDDVKGTYGGDAGVTITELAEDKEMIRDYCEYVRRLLEAARLETKLQLDA